MAVQEAQGEPKLKRAAGLTQITLFGLGSMLGAGIYGLIGKAAAELGSAVWVAFLVSMVAALLTGLSYASIASRYPRAGGAAYVTQMAYRRPMVSYVVGLAVVCSGLTSIATQSNVVAANIAETFGIGAPHWLLAIGFLVLLSGVLFRGISESLWLNAVCTLVEAFGLILVISVGVSYWGNANLLEFPASEGGGGMEGPVALLVMQGAVLTFFSFIGFEDMLNVSEEVKNPERTMPLAFILAILAATVIYIAVSITAVSVVPWQELAEAAGPLTLVVERAAPWFPVGVFAAITIFAVANTALVNYVMASRLLYGMSRQGLFAGPARPRPQGASHTLCRDLRASGHRAPPLVAGGYRGSGFLDRPTVADGLHHRQRRVDRPEAAAGRQAGQVRGPGHRPGARRAILCRPADRADCGGRLDRTADRRWPRGRDRHSLFRNGRR